MQNNVQKNMQKFLQEDLKIIKNTASMNIAGEGELDSLLPEIADSINILNGKLSSIEITQRSLESLIKSGKIDNDKLDRIIDMSIRIQSDFIEGFYCLKSSIQSYIAELDIDEKFKDFRTDKKTEIEEEGDVWSVELYDFTYSDKGIVEDIVTL